MISTRALSSFDDMMIQGIKSGLVGRSDAVDQLTTLEALSEIEAAKLLWSKKLSHGQVIL